jgi:type IV pilus assembly protein PilC
MPKVVSSIEKALTISIGSPVSRRDLIDFVTLMGFLAEVGIPLVQALEIAANDCENPPFKVTLTDLRRLLEGGLTFSEGLERFPRFFSFQFIGIIRAGESSGSLVESFRELKRYMEWQERTSSDVKQATIYPAMVLLSVTILVGVLFSFVVPTFASLLKEMKADLPTSTRIVLGLSDFMKAHWPPIFIGLFAGPVLIKLSTRYSHTMAVLWDRIWMSLPLLGEISLMLYMTRFAHNLAILYRNGVILVQALKLCEKLVGSPLVADRLVDVRRAVEAGESLSEALRKHPVFPVLLLRMVSVGEKTGSLDRTLVNIAEYYGMVVTERIKRMFQILEPTLILVLIFIVGFVAFAVMSPMFTMMTNISR